MDLGTIENRMNANVIESPEEFARLVRLTFTNAIKYNPGLITLFIEPLVTCLLFSIAGLEQ
ncbi:hypothetical protein QTG54_001119 [Skeletonema marinoi]|uniref:Bromo domain-containing protein n=1 Tax=Skeletonema marinoi TaxID=267567 RepID=A0AAD8YQ06_9STRA|nr:hypothetical protein QTG54_001119 [Skeletonema marinoi]